MTTIITFESIMDVSPVNNQVVFPIIAAIALITFKLQPPVLVVLGYLVSSYLICSVCLKGAKVAREL